MKKEMLSLALLTASSAALASTLDTIEVPSPSLSGVPVASESRETIVYLPDGYHESEQNYPVLYVLHGYGGDADGWFVEGGELNLQTIVDELIKNESIDDLIVVVPSTFTINLAAWYQPSAITGDWRAFILDDLSEHIEANYRVDGQQSILGHSMGAYGAIDLAMYEQFSAVAAMSPPGYMLRPLPVEFSIQNHASNKEAFDNYTGVFDELDYMQHANVALSQLIVPAPENAPIYFNNEPSMQQFKRFSELALMNKVDNRWQSLSDTPIRMEIGVQEGQAVVDEVTELAEQLSDYNIATELHTFDGGHTDKMHITLKDNLVFIDQQWD